MANQYSREDALANNYSAGNYGNIPGRIMPWSRNTVADGWWLNRETLTQLSGRDQYLLDALNSAYDNATGIKFNTTTGGQGQTETFRSDFVLVNNAAGYNANSDNYGLYISAHDENNVPYTAEYYLWPKDGNVLDEPVPDENIQIPILRWTNHDNTLRLGYRSVTNMFGNYVSAYGNQKITICSADELPAVLEEGVYYLV